MEQRFTIGQAAEILEIPAATLRFWESRGLLQVQKGKNRYRTYSRQNLAEIADLVFYHNLGASLSQIQKMQTFTLEEYGENLKNLEKQLEQKIAEYETMLQQNRCEIENVREVERLRVHFGEQEDIPFQAVESFDYAEKEKMLRYVNQPSCYVRYYHSQDLHTEQRCILAREDSPRDRLVWEKRPGSRFVTVLIREKTDQNYESDLGQSLEILRRSFKTGEILAQYLMTANENGHRTDYLKGYIEILPG